MPLKKYLDYDGLDYLIQRIPRTKIKVTFDDVFAGETATCSMGTTTYTKTVPATEPYELVFPINELGTWTIATSYLGDDYGTTIEVTAIGQTATGHVSYVTEIDGATVTPTDDITTWLKCANIEDPTVTTLADVLANRSLFETLIANSNACKYMARSTTWAAAEGAVPTLATTSSNVISSGDYSGQPAWKVFDGDNSTPWSADAPYLSGGAYVGYKFDTSKNINSLGYVKRYESASSTQVWKVQGSSDGTDWIDLSDNFTVLTAGDNDKSWHYINFTNANSYSYYRVYEISNNNNSLNPSFMELQFYEADITRNQDAMALIGRYDYCSNELLSNATWKEAIAKSEYYESVFNNSVPTMTSNTTPSGVASASSVYDATNYPAYKGFDNDFSGRGWCPAKNSTVNNTWIQYEFESSVVVKYLLITQEFNSETGQTKGTEWSFLGSNNGTDFTEIATGLTVSSLDTKEYFNINNSTSYKYYRLVITDVTGSSIGGITSGQGYKFQFYARKSNEVLVPLVPTMTSDTQPTGTGTVIYSSQYTDQKGFYAFDGVTSDSWSTDQTEFPCYIGYHFNTAKVVSRCSVLQRINGTFNGVTETAKVQASNDGETWTDLTDSQTFVIMVASNASWINIDFSNSTAYTYYRLYITAVSNANVWGTCAELQFYQKQAQTNIIHSAANDTIYMMENGSQVPLCTTNSNGDGILDFTQFMDGTYTLYSSVAKDPTNLSNDYSKSVRITKTSYGCTTEVYLMPDTIKTLYWFGRKDSNLEDCTSVNGWSVSYSYVTLSIGGSPIYNTNAIRLSTSSNIIIGIGTKNKISTSQLNIVCEPITLSSASRIIATELKTSKYLTNQSDKYYHQVGNTTTPVNTKSFLTLEGSEIETYFEVDTWGGSVTDINALWYE